MRRKQNLKRGPGEVRIIGGLFRGRKIYFPDSDSLRPTPNRVRETLFNWLAPYIQGASCLDLFAGSGALSFEAISRGAKYCLALDFSREIVQSLIDNRSILGLSQMDIVQASFPYDISLFKESFDIIFLDPPFHQGYVPLALEWLVDCQCLKEEALIYIECAKDEEISVLPNNWEVIKNKVAGHVRYMLLQAGNPS